MLIKSIEDINKNSHKIAVFRYIMKNINKYKAEPQEFTLEYKNLFKNGPIYFRSLNYSEKTISISNDIKITGKKKTIIKADFIELLLNYMYMTHIQVYFYINDPIFKLELQPIKIAYKSHYITKSYISNFKLNNILCNAELLQQYGGKYFKTFFKEEKANYLNIDIKYEGESTTNTINYMSYLIEYIYTGDLKYVDEQILVDLFTIANYMKNSNLLRLIINKLMASDRIYFIYKLYPELWEGEELNIKKYYEFN